MLRTKKVKLTFLPNLGFSNKFRNQLSSLTDSFVFFGTKFAQKGHFWTKTEKVDITFEFSIFELM